MQSENGMKKAAFAMLFALVLLVGLTATAWAQSAGTGAILGSVKDPSGAVVAGADVTVKNIDTGAERKFTTTDTGRYAAPYLQPGRYEVRVRREGFAEVIRQNVVVEVGQTVTADIDLPLKAAGHNAGGRLPEASRTRGCEPRRAGAAPADVGKCPLSAP